MLRMIGNLAAMAAVSALVITLAFSAGYGAACTPQPSPVDVVPAPAAGEPASEVETVTSIERERTMALFWEAWELLEQDFYGDLPPMDQAIREAIRGLLRSLGDENTFLLDPEMARMAYEDIQGQFEGIGASVRTDENGFFTIVQPFENSPADRAGLRPGDIVLEVNGENIQGLTTAEVITRIRGPAGSVVRLLIFRPETQEQFTVEIVRARIDIPTIETRWFEEQKIGYLRLREFNAVAPRQVHQALRELLRKKPAGLILDLRSNPGGLLDASVEIASEFIGSGVIVEERFRDGSGDVYEALPGGLATSPTLPLVVLVNGASASASEIVAGAIQDTGRGILIGTPTFGKGSVQLPHQLSDGSQLRITVAHWFTPSGKDIHKEGLTPDIEVELSWDDYRAGNDTQLQSALEYLRRKTGQTSVLIPESVPLVALW